MPFNKTFANQIRRQARTKLSEEINLRDPDLRRLVGHANLLDDLLIRTSLAVRGWDGDGEDDEHADIDAADELELEEGEGARLYKDEGDDEDSDDDSDSDSDRESENSSDDEEWWEQPLLPNGTIIEGTSSCDKGTTVQVVKTVEEILAISEITEGCDICEDTESSFGQQTPCAAVGQLSTIEESKWETTDDSMDIDNVLTTATRVLTPERTYGGTYGTFGESFGLNPDDFVGPYSTVMDIDICSCKELELLGLA